jgi:hypothetical protein
MADGAAVCVCILFYGAGEKYLNLAKRVLNAPMRQLAQAGAEFRFGCNAVGESTRKYLNEQASAYFPAARFFDEPQNVFKYPLMRRMFHEQPITAPTAMWFDHDSYLAPELNTQEWLPRVQRQLTGCDMIGSVHKSALTPEQTAWLDKQPWKTNSDLSRYTTHAVGSWWTINTPLLYKYDWPPSNLQQKGGDVLFGELFRQQNLLLCHFRDGVRINVNDAGVESATPRTVV